MSDILDVAVRAARAGGKVLLAHAGQQLRVTTKSSDTDPVSQADHDSEAELVALIRAARPDDGILGEEGAHSTSDTGLRWVLDPLDGTVNFLYGHVGWVVSVACEERVDDGWRARAGVVYDPVADELFSAERGAGAFLDGRPLQVNDPVRLERALIATGFAYDRAHRASQAQTVQHVLARARDIRRVGAAALDLCAVAAGRVDGYYEDSTARWDWAAGALIAAEAGAVIEVLPGPVDGQSGVIAAGRALYPHLAALVRQEPRGDAPAVP